MRSRSSFPAHAKTRSRGSFLLAGTQAPWRRAQVADASSSSIARARPARILKAARPSSQFTVASRMPAAPRTSISISSKGRPARVPDCPTISALANATLQVARNIGLPAQRNATCGARMAEIRARVKHVIFIIKENRTYDQVLGDLDVGNGDPRLAILGGALSPNHHRLARQFVTLDSFYDLGESRDGLGLVNGGPGHRLDREDCPGELCGSRACLQVGGSRPLHLHPAVSRRASRDQPEVSEIPTCCLDPRCSRPDPDDDDRPNEGFLWDAAIRAGLSVRNYGFCGCLAFTMSAAPGFVPVFASPSRRSGDLHPGRPAACAVERPLFSGLRPKVR